MVGLKYPLAFLLDPDCGERVQPTFGVGILIDSFPPFEMFTYLMNLVPEKG